MRLSTAEINFAIKIEKYYTGNMKKEKLVEYFEEIETIRWILDIHFSEDYCRIVNRTIQQNLNMLRKFALSIIKQFKANTNSKRAISKIMFDCLLDPLAICSVLEN